ncbi:MAG TPA: hypothetical protein VKG92_07275 [Flavobacteriales bacterium]|nr:hypothetical protein [Flavobacteriales bacterium]
MVATLATVSVLTTTATMPFAVVSDTVVAGIFSVVNTTLTAILIRVLRNDVKPTVEETHGMLNRRNRQHPPPDHQYKREGDPP